MSTPKFMKIRIAKTVGGITLAVALAAAAGVFFFHGKTGTPAVQAQPQVQAQKGTQISPGAPRVDPAPQLLFTLMTRVRSVATAKGVNNVTIQAPGLTDVGSTFPLTISRQADGFAISGISTQVCTLLSERQRVYESTGKKSPGTCAYDATGKGNNIVFLENKLVGVAQ